MELTLDLARKVIETVDCGLSNGLGNPIPGQMCVEAAVCYAMGLPHSDNPTCVGSAIRSFKICLNDNRWSSSKARAIGLRKLSIAQLGSDKIDQVEFTKALAKLTIQQIIPLALSYLKQTDQVKEAIEKCKDGSIESARYAQKTAAAAAAYAADDADAADAAYDNALSKSADLAVQALRELNCEGVRLMDELGL